LLIFGTLGDELQNLFRRQFDGGNIAVIKVDDPADIHLEVVQDNQSDFLQWFYFRLSGAKGTNCTLSIDNASKTTYPHGWEGYSVVTSHDLISWYRTPATYDGQALSWSITPEHDAVYFAYFAPYSLNRHAQKLAGWSDMKGVTQERLGATLDGRDIDCLHIEDAEAAAHSAGRTQIWTIGRQHPGEPMAQWWMEGWLNRLLNENDATSVSLRKLCDIHVVPNMNPDGSYRGHLRTNAVGSNLNREWASASMARSPEVFLVQKRMAETGVDFCLDIHGDEALPYNFIAGTEGVSNWSEQRDQQLIAFKRTLAALNPDFQTEHGYPRNSPNSANLSFCSNSVAQTYGCPAYTLEMPFKDTIDTPKPDVGWSPERCAALGSSFVDAVYLAMTDRML